MTDAPKQNRDTGAQGGVQPGPSDRTPPDDLAARETGGPSIHYAPSPEGDAPQDVERPELSARDLQANASQDELEAHPGSDADQANESPHVG